MQSPGPAPHIPVLVGRGLAASCCGSGQIYAPDMCDAKQKLLKVLRITAH